MSQKSDNGLNPVAGFNFLLRVDAVYDLPCKRISGIKQELEYESIQEGGVNDYVHLRKKPVTRPYTFEVERYVSQQFFDPLPIGRQLDKPIILYVSRYLNDFKKPKRTFIFSGCTVLGKSYSDLDAMGNDLMTETTTIAYQELLVKNQEPDVIRKVK